MRITLTVATPQGETDVVVDCDDTTPGAVLSAAIAAGAGLPGAPVGVPARALAADHRSAGGTDVAGLGLRDGMRVGVGAVDVTVPAPGATGLQLHVVSGPDSGAVFTLTQGVHEIGRTGPVSWRDHSLSRRHCRVIVSPTSVTVTDLGSSNGTFVDGARVGTQPVTWPLGAVLEIGDSLVELRHARGVDADVEPAAPGLLGFVRPPRIHPFHVPTSVDVPAPPESPQRRFRRGDTAEHRRAAAAYEQELAAARVHLAEVVAAEQQRLRDELPDAAETFLTSVLPGRRLWERRRHDRDALTLRLGTADLTSTVTASGVPTGGLGPGGALGALGPAPLLPDVPVGVGLRECPVLGLAGPADAVDGVLRWVAVQLATYHAPHDLAMTFISATAGPEWAWLRWLPHLRTTDPAGPVAAVGNDPTTVGARVAALVAMVRSRTEVLLGAPGTTADSFPAHVVLVHGYRALRGTPGLDVVLADGPAVGVHAVCTDDAETALPERASATVLVDGGNPSYGAVLRTRHAAVPRARLERVGPAWCERVARELAPLRHVGAAEEGSDESLPTSVRLLDLVGASVPTPDAVRARWTIEPRSTTATLGVGASGPSRPVTVDLLADGPHGLVAGAAGAGTSELLRSMVASLAVANRPDQLNVVLLGAGLEPLAGLPHVVGTLDRPGPDESARALAALRAEVRRRQALLAAAGASEAATYHALVTREPHRPPLPRLLVVVDGLDEVGSSAPDLVPGLVGLAKLGADAGLHLVLATDRPGSMGPAVRATTRWRVALRLDGAPESIDLLRSSEASRIPPSVPGRGYLVTGPAAPVAFQAGRVTALRPGADGSAPPPFIAPVGWHALGHPAPQPPRRGGHDAATGDTDLAALVTTVRHAADLEGVPRQGGAFLDALSDGRRGRPPSPA